MSRFVLPPTAPVMLIDNQPKRLRTKTEEGEGVLAMHRYHEDDDSKALLFSLTPN